MPGPASSSSPRAGPSTLSSSATPPSRAPPLHDMLIDVHNHFYPPEYLDALKAGDSAVKLTVDAEGNPCLHYPGDYNVAVRGHRDIAYRAEFLRNGLRDAKIDTQVITLTTPGTHIEEPRTAVRLAQITNDAFARAVSDYRGLYVALATLPLCDPAASVAELRRAMEQLKFRGAMVFSNINGRSEEHTSEL